MKRVISLLLSLAIITVCFSGVNAYAKTSGAYKYRILKNKTVELIDYIGEAPSTLELPSVINGKKVTQIGDGFEASNWEIKKLIIPKSVERIGNHVFEEALSLKAVVIPDNVKYIGEFSFCRCKNLEKISISKNLKKLGLNSFAYNECFKTIAELNENGIYERKAVYINSYLLAAPCVSRQKKSYKITKGTTLIAGGAIDGIKTLTIPSSVKHIDEYAFASRGAETINLSEKNKSYIVKNQILYSKDMKELIYCANADIKSFTVPKCVKKICPYAFSSCEKLKKIVLNNGLKTIGDYAFFNCLSLKTIKIPKSVTKIGEYAVGSRYILPDEVYDEGRYPTVDGCRIIGYRGGGVEDYLMAFDNKQEYVNCFIAVPPTPKASVKKTKKGFIISYKKTTCPADAYAEYVLDRDPQFKVKFKKKKQADGYQVEYTKNNISKTITYKSPKSAKRTVKGLKSGKYKVRIRAYKKERGRTVYSDWSAKKTVIIK